MVFTRFLLLCFVSQFAFACATSTEPRLVSNQAAAADQLRVNTGVNINTASAEELEKLPYIGPGVALKILAYREKNGPFRRAEHLMLIDGISEKRFREIRLLIRVE